MKKLFFTIAILSTFFFSSTAVFAFGGPYKFNASDFDTPEKLAKEADSRIDISGKGKFKDNKVKNIGIFEFYVEFLQSREITQSVYESRNSTPVSFSAQMEKLSGPLKLSTSTIKFTGDYYKDAIISIYEILASELTKAGFKLVPREEMANDPAYKKMELASEAQGGGYTGGVFKSGEITKTLKMSVDGLGLFPEHTGVKNVFSAIGKANLIKNTEALVAIDKKLDAIAKVYIFIDKAKSGAPQINEFQIVFDMAPVNDPSYPYMKAEQGTTIKLEKPISSGEDIKSGGSVDVEKYNKILLDMTGTVSRMIALSLSGLLK